MRERNREREIEVGVWNEDNELDCIIQQLIEIERKLITVPISSDRSRDNNLSYTLCHPSSNGRLILTKEWRRLSPSFFLFLSLSVSLFVIITVFFSPSLTLSRTNRLRRNWISGLGNGAKWTLK